MSNTYSSSDKYNASSGQRGQAKGSASKPAAKPETHASEPSLKGTFASVMLLGGFIVASWVLVLTLFLLRN